MARPKKDPEIKRKAFMDAAADLFFKKGYDNTSIQDILLAVGNGNALSPSVFYYYFNSKDELFESMVQQYMKEHIDHLIQILDNPNLSYQDKMNQALKIQENAILDFKNIDTYFDCAAKRNKYFNYIIDTQAIDSLVDPLAKLVQEGIQTGKIQESPLLKQAGPRLTVQIFLYSILPLTHQGREKDGQHKSEQYLPLIPLIMSHFFNISSIFKEDKQ